MLRGHNSHIWQPERDVFTYRLVLNSLGAVMLLQALSQDCGPPGTKINVCLSLCDVDTYLSAAAEGDGEVE